MFYGRSLKSNAYNFFLDLFYMKKYLTYEYCSKESSAVKQHIFSNGFKLSTMNILDTTNKDISCGNYDFPWSEQKLKIIVNQGSRLETVLDSYISQQKR